MIGKLLLEGLGLGAVLVLICFVGIRKGAVGMVQLYHKDVQDRCVSLGLTTYEKIKQRASRIRLISLTAYLTYVIGCVYGINGARGFRQGFVHIFVILSIMNLIDRFLIDELWVCHTKAWVIPGTEEIPFVQTWPQVLKKRGILTLIWIVGAAVIAGIVVLL